MSTHRPHKAIVNIQLEVYSLLDTGECSAKVVNQHILKQYGINPAFLIAVDGDTMDDCLNNLKNKLEKLNEHDE